MSETSPKKELLGALIALARATEGNESKVTPSLDRLVLQSLASNQEEEISLLLEKVRIQKHMLAPDCAVCASPCGRTSEYDFQELEDSEADIRTLKLDLIKKIQEPDFANRFPDSSVSWDLYRILFYIGLDCTADQFKDGLSGLL